MHYVRAGSGAPPLVFVHGFACSHADWHFQVEHFRKSREVVACDLRGHGATPGRPQECSVEHYGGDVAALLANLDLPKAVLVGHSMGCRVVLEANRLAPDHVAGLVLIDGSRQALGDPGAAERNSRALLAANGYAPFMRRFFEEMFLAQTDLSRAIVERALRLPADVGTELFAKLARWDAGSMDAALEAVRAPVLAIQSTYVNTERRRVPLEPGRSTPWLDALREKVPGASVRILSGQGHFPQIEAAASVNSLIEEARRSTGAHAAPRGR